MSHVLSLYPLLSTTNVSPSQSADGVPHPVRLGTCLERPAIHEDRAIRQVVMEDRDNARVLHDQPVVRPFGRKVTRAAGQALKPGIVLV